ncbi:MAG: sigma-70 family RNA polymerase sigma factor [Pirellula sp.]|nr:sigma-70 family RNA polymerase sigma factor [Pirellula sp.]
MGKKITSKTLEKMLLDYSIRQRIASIDFGTYFPLRSRSANATNPFAQAKANPGLPVAFEILTEPPLSGSVVWETTARLPIQPACLNSDDFWLEPESPLTTLGALGAASAPQDEDLSSSEPEYEESEDLASQPLDGEFRFSLDSQEFKVFDIQTTPPDGSRPSIDVIQPNGKIDYDGKRGKKNLSNPDSTLQARVVKKSKGGEVSTADDTSISTAKDAPSKDEDLTSQQVLYLQLIIECYERHKERWFRDYGEDACQVGIFSVIKYVNKTAPSEYKPSFRKTLVEAITDEEFTALSRILRTRIKSRRIDLIRKGLASGDRVVDHTSIDPSLSSDDDGYSLASTIVGRELTPDQALLIKEEIQFKDERLRRAVEQLTDRQRRALELRYEPNTYERCAEEMGLKLSAFRSLLKRAKDRLKEILIEEDKYKTGR